MDGHQRSDGRASARRRPSNVQVDTQGHLHLAITRQGGRVTAAELFSKEDMGFGTYQWQIEGPVDRMDPHAVLGLFPYRPEHGIGRDGENEIDVEFSKWGNTLCGGSCNADFTIYPSSGNLALGPTEHNYSLDPSGPISSRRESRGARLRSPRP